MWKHGFNYSAINNFGSRYANGQYLLLLNNDTEVITPDWIEQMLMFAQRKDVGAVGGMLYYPDNTIQHAGVIIGIDGCAGHSHKFYKRGEYGYCSRLAISRRLAFRLCIRFLQSQINSVKKYQKLDTTTASKTAIPSAIQSSVFALHHSKARSNHHIKSPPYGVLVIAERKGAFFTLFCRFLIN